MRVIAGEFRSRRLKSVPGAATRPTSDRLRETLFDILNGAVEGAVFLDVYAGTGAVGIEALSRGAARAVFVDRSRAAVAVIRENLASLGLEARATVVFAPALQAVVRHRADIVFLDPPYALADEYQPILELLGGSPARVIVAQHSTRVVLPEACGTLRRTRVVTQGDNALSFFQAAAS